ncbi:hypothetical protein M514_12466 [Trichuris suis]|uniref:Uncharacterized protein n=1 Tax=Trichuris suis TaxID=68888 RepID=A0A085LNW1_9BILA|nr:hypothetical protein M513_12466 [Trichuris suis]KFD64152.1 hypothetical protein M514_12466 [Trichuris suis]KHJ47186.1 hypothetical protein D918_02752 [Trichuris suis]
MTLKENPEVSPTKGIAESQQKVTGTVSQMQKKRRRGGKAFFSRLGQPIEKENTCSNKELGTNNECSSSQMVSTRTKAKVVRGSRGLFYKQVNNFLYNCIQMILTDPTASGAVAMKIDCAKDFLAANVAYVKLNVFTMTKFALVDQTSSLALAKLVWMVHNVLPSNAAILREVVLSCNRVIPKRYGMLKSSNTEWANEVRSCCIFFSYLVKEMGEHKSHYNPFLRIFSELLSNLLATGSVENISCFLEAIKNGGQVLLAKRKEDFEYMTVVLEHLAVVKWKEKPIKELYDQLCALRHSWGKEGKRKKHNAVAKNECHLEPEDEGREEDESFDHLADSIANMSVSITETNRL